MRQVRAAAVWVLLIGVVVISVAVAANSPLLEWRTPVYITAGFAGVCALSLLLFQPLLAAGLLPGISTVKSKRVHRWVGSGLTLSVVVHVGALWITSPPDVVDALLIRSPTPFSIWGVLAMWGVFIAACLAFFRQRLPIRPRAWRLVHKSLAAVTVAGSVIHALKIEGTMGNVSKILLCASVVLIGAFVLLGFYKKWNLAH